MERKVMGIVIHRTPYRDNDAIIKLLTADNEILSVTVYGAKSQKDGKCSSSQLLIYGEFVLSSKNDRYTLKSGAALEYFHNITTDYERFETACMMIKTISDMFPENVHIIGDLFSYTYYCLTYMSYSDMCHSDVYIFFLLHTLKIAGFTPRITECAVCGKSLLEHKNIGFFPDLGGAVCEKCAYPDTMHTITPLCLEAMRRMLLMKCEDVKNVSLPPAVRKSILRHISLYVEYIKE